MCKFYKLLIHEDKALKTIPGARTVAVTPLVTHLNCSSVFLKPSKT